MIFFIIWLVSFILLLIFFIAVNDASLNWIIISLIPIANTLILLTMIIGILTLPYRIEKKDMKLKIKEQRKAKLKKIKRSKQLIKF